MTDAIKVEVLGLPEFNLALGKLATRLADFKPVFAAIAPEFYAAEARQFESEGQGSWPALAESTVKQKAAAGYGSKPILQRTGKLYESLTVQGAPFNVTDIGETEATFGTNVPYAILHQLGGGKLPRRREIDPTDADKQKFVSVAQTRMRELLHETGFTVV